MQPQPCSAALLALDLGQPTAPLRCCAGLKRLGVSRIVLALAAHLHDVRGLRDRIQDLLQSELVERKGVLENQGFTVETGILLGDAHSAVARMAAEKNCDLVVVGSRVHSLAGDILLGGVAGDLLHYGREPLLLLRFPHEAPEACACPLTALDRVLFATDFSDNAEHAWTHLLGLVEGGVKDVVLLHVQDSRKIPESDAEQLRTYNEIDTQRLERLRDVLVERGAASVAIELPYGHPAKILLDRSRQGDLSLMVLGRQGRGYLHELFVGSTSHAIARHSPVPLLLVPMPAAEA
jgi:nucleotide-binding universal stress UspA family protein